jgi:hypothetical protein
MENKKRTPLRTAKEPRPPEAVLAWCEALVAQTKDGGVWAIPRSQVVFRIDHTNETLWCVDGPDDLEKIVAELNVNRDVFAHIGWRVGVRSDAKLKPAVFNKLTAQLLYPVSTAADFNHN